MNASRISMVAAASVALLAGTLTLLAEQPPKGDQPSTQPGGPGGPPGGGGGGEGRRPGRGGGGGDGADRPRRSEWADKLQDEVRDHPRLGRALVALHEARDYLDKAQGDLGGHKASSIKSCDDAIKELTEAIKFDPKREGRGGGGGGGGDSPKTTTPPPTPKP